MRVLSLREREDCFFGPATPAQDSDAGVSGTGLTCFALIKELIVLPAKGQEHGKYHLDPHLESDRRQASKAGAAASDAALRQQEEGNWGKRSSITSSSYDEGRTNQRWTHTLAHLTRFLPTSSSTLWRATRQAADRQAVLSRVLPSSCSCKCKGEREQYLRMMSRRKAVPFRTSR